MDPAAPPISLADLTDALARSRLTPAELAALAPRELEALFELGASRLEVGRDADAVVLFAGLVRLYPFRGKYWRAYGIALQRQLAAAPARAAYDCALALEPGHRRTRCYRGEICIWLGDRPAARADLEAVRADHDDALARRASALLRCLEGLGGWQPPPGPPQPPDSTPEPFLLGDGSSLPRGAGPLAGAPPAAAVTQPLEAFAPAVADLWEPRADTAELTGRWSLALAAATSPLRAVTTPLARPAEETVSMVAPGAGAAAASAPEQTDITETALIPGRPAALARQPQPMIDPERTEVTQTAIVRRRLHRSLCDMSEAEWEGER